MVYLVWFICLASPVCINYLSAQETSYPENRRGDVVDNYHGTLVADPFRWLEDINSTETLNWIESQNSISIPYLDALPARAHFINRLNELNSIKGPDQPQRQWSYWITKVRKENGGNHFVVQDSLNGQQRIILDPDVLFPNEEMAVRHVRISPDGLYLIYTISPPGIREMEARVYDLINGKDLPETIPGLKFNAPFWTADSKGLVYYRYLEIDAQGRDMNSAVFYHKIGTQMQDDLMLVQSELGEIGSTTWSRVSESGRFIFIYDELGGKQKVSVIDLGDPLYPNFSGPLIALNEYRDGTHEIIGTDKNNLFLKTTRNAPRGKIVTVRIDNPLEWKNVLPESNDVLQHARLFGSHIVTAYRRDVKSVLEIYSLEGKNRREIQLPAMGSVFRLNGHKSLQKFIFSFDSYAHPLTVIQYDFNTTKSENVAVHETVNNPSDYITKQIFFSSKDGTQVPMFVTHLKNIKLDGSTPTLLYGYGAGGIEEPIFQDDWFSWIEAGGVLAVANVRGGEEYGKEWEMAGRKQNKQNTFDDFIAAAERLISDGYTSSEHLAIYGVSNGGLLIGSVMTQRPDLFAVAIPSVGVLDVLRFPKFTAGPRWAVNNGNSADPVEFNWLYSWSPLHRLTKGKCYPATLVLTASNDDLVHPSQSYKYAAKLQTVQNCSQQILLRTYDSGGHDIGYFSETQADLLAFTAYHTGLNVN